MYESFTDSVIVNMFSTLVYLLLVTSSYIITIVLASKGEFCSGKHQCRVLIW